MSRNKRSKSRITETDPVYNSQQVAKLINRIMRDGKKTVACAQIYKAFDLIKAKLDRNPLDVFEQALKQITPQMEVRSRRVGGAAYQVPMPVRGVRGFSLAIRWLVTEARKRPSKEYRTYAEKLAQELMDASRGEGGAMQKKLTFHRMAEANKAFAHFRW